MQKIKTLALCAVTFAATLLLLWLALTLSALIPNSALYDNMCESALTYREKDAYSIEGDYLGTASDNYADTILLQLSMNIGNGNPLVGALDTQYYDGENYGENLGFYMSLINDTVTPNVDYSRYWHGSAMFLRLLCLITDVNGAKLIGFAAVLLLAAATAAILLCRRHYDLAAAFALSLVSVHIWNVCLSLEYIPAFAVGFAMCSLYLLFERHSDSSLLYLSIIGGTAVAFFDFLTNETVSILLPLILVVAVRAKEKRLGDFRQSLHLIVKCGIGWGSSYVATFVAKWTLATLVTGENKFTAAFSSAGERFAGSTASEGVDNAFVRIFAAPVANLSTLFGGMERIELGRVVLGLIIVVMVTVSIFYLCGKTQYDKTATSLLALLGAVVFVRFMVLNNHSYLHEFFTYRALVSPIMALFSIILLNIKPPKRKKIKVNKK